MSAEAPDEGTAAGGPGFRELARAAARGEVRADEGVLLRELLLLRAADDAYAVPVERVREIVRLRPITPIPRAPRVLLGVVALRGEMIEVVDLRRRLGLPEAEPRRMHRIVVLHTAHGEATGLLVDAASDVLRVQDSALGPPPAGESGAVVALCTWQERFVSVLDVDRVLDLGVAG
jgi:purine-binding chemotaxis protein CheW